MFRSWLGDSSRSKTSTSAPRCIDRISSSWSLPEPITVRPSGLRRFCSAVSTTRSPAVSASRCSSAIPRSAARRSARVSPTRIAPSPPAVCWSWGLRANCPSRSPMKAAKSSSQLWTDGRFSTRHMGSPSSPGAAGGRARPGRGGRRRAPAARRSRQLEQGQVGQLVFGQRLGAQLGQDEPNTAESARTGPSLAQVRDEDTARIADDHLLDAAAAVEEQPESKAGLLGELGQRAGQLGRDERGPVDPALVEGPQCADLGGLEAGGVAEQLVQGRAPGSRDPV